jgi:hypothetical protein
MSEREKFLLEVIVGLISNPTYYHEVTAPHKDLAKTVVNDAKAIVKEVFGENNHAPSA